MTRDLLTRLAASVFLVLTAYGAEVPVFRTQPFIVSGDPTHNAEFPWQVLLRMLDIDLCGGAILSDVWVLTAGHCALLLDEALVGTTRKSAGGEHYQIAEVHRHPKYKFGQHDYDIAVVKMASPFNFSSSVQPVGSLASEEPQEGTPVTVTGWGRQNENATKYSEDLMKVTVNVVPRSACSQVLGAEFTPRMFCASSPGKDSCQGDSGGPVVRANTTELVGIVSWGVGCARDGKPGVYTNVAVLREWIKEMTGV